MPSSRKQPRACVWLTGLSGSGKSTTAAALAERLTALGHRVAILDGDAVRARLSPQLGFSRRDREANVLRVAQLARDAMDNGEIAICALISPYRDSRERARAVIDPAVFVEVFLDTPLAVCEARDVKGLYRRARAGVITGVTGIDDPYEPPVAPDVRLITDGSTLEDNIRVLLRVLEQRGAIDADAATAQLSTEADFSRPR
jgi:adenylyl-sulfate kinase